MEKSLEKQLTIWLRNQKSACGFFLHLSVLMGVINGVALVAQAWLVASVLQGVIIDNGNAADFYHQFLVIAGLIIVRTVAAYARERLSFTAGVRLRQTLRAEVLNKLERLGPSFIHGKPAGSWASIVLEHIEDLHEFYAKYLPQVSLAAFIPLIILACVFPINWAGGLILLATAPLIPLFMILVGWGAAEANRKNFAALSRLSGHFLDRLKGLPTLKLFSREQGELDHIEQASEEFRSRTMSVLKMAFLSSAVLEFFAAVSIAVLAVYFGFSYLGYLDFGHYGQSITLFTGMFVLILAPEFYQPLRDMGTHYHAKAQAVGAAEALTELLQQPELHRHGDQQVEGPLTIVARDLRVLSHDERCLLGPLNFQIEPGKHIGLVGPSGAGKTSLLNALLGFLPVTGQLTVNGVDFSELDRTSYRKQLAWLGQSPQLFQASIRDNVALASPQMHDDEVQHLLQQARVDELTRQPDGIHYVVGEQGMGISVGQAQRIALARALAQHAFVYLLDEPTASLDSVNQGLVQQSLNQAIAGKTSLVITHKLEELKMCDEILVLDAGQIVQRGTYAQLCQDSGLFVDMLTMTMDKGVEAGGRHS